MTTSEPPRPARPSRPGRPGRQRHRRAPRQPIPAWRHARRALALRARTSRSPRPSPAVSPCACSTQRARKPRSRYWMTTPTSGMRSCPASARDSPTGIGSAGLGTRPRACAATRPNCCSTPTQRRSAERSRSGRRYSARDETDPGQPSRLDSAGHVPGAWSWTRISLGRMTNAPGTATRIRSSMRSTSRASPCATRTFPRRSAGPTPAWATRPRSRTCSTWASPPSNCCPYTRTCRSRSWSNGA